MVSCGHGATYEIVGSLNIATRDIRIAKRVRGNGLPDIGFRERAVFVILNDEAFALTDRMS